MARRRKRSKKPSLRKAPAKTLAYNVELFPNFRSIRRALKRLGYKVSLMNAKVPSALIRQFQRDFNLVALDGHPDWGILKIDRVMGARTLIALEIALAYAQKMAAKKDVSVAQFWRTLARALQPKKPKQGPVGSGKMFVEILGFKMGRLRRGKDDLRVRIEDLARKGNLLFAKVTIPKQATHAGDRHPRWYPAIAR